MQIPPSSVDASPLVPSQQAAEAAPSSVKAVVQKFASVSDPKEKARMLLQAGQGLAPFPEAGKVAVNRVMGCTTQVRGCTPYVCE